MSELLTSVAIAHLMRNTGAPNTVMPKTTTRATRRAVATGTREEASVIDEHVTPEALWPLIGRDAELARALASLRHGARSVFLHGGSGTGKSRIAHAIGEVCAEEGWLVLQAAGNRALSAIPFATFAPALARGDNAPVLPAATDPLTLFTTADAAISMLAGERRVLLVLDDLPASDHVSLTLIGQLVAAGRMQVIATVVDGDPVPDAALPIAAGPSAVRIDIADLDVDDVSTLLSAALGAPVAHRDVVQLHSSSHGNPLFLRELVLGAWAAGGFSRVDGRWHLVKAVQGTPALRDLIRARLRELPAAERDVVERLAVCQPLRMSEFASAEAPLALAELELRAMITVDESGHGVSIMLSHPHYAAAVREAMPRIRAIALLNEQSSIVEHNGMDPADELRVAMWRLDAGDRADHDLLLRAARLALRAQDHRTAARLTGAIVGSSDADAETLLLHAELMWTLARGPEALQALERAEVAARASDRPQDLLPAIASRRAEVYGADPLGSERGIRLLDEVEEADPAQRVSVLLAKTTLVMHLLRAHEAMTYLDEVEPYLAHHPAGAGILAINRATPLSYLQRSDDAIAAGRIALAHARSEGAAFPARKAAMVLAGVLIENDVYDEAQTLVVESLHDAIRDEDHMTARMDELHMGRVLWMRGRLDSASRWLRDAVSGAERHGPGSVRSPALGLLAVAAAEQSDLERARALRARMDEGYDHDDSLTALADAWISCTAGDIEEAAQILITRAETVIPRGAYGIAATFLHQLVRLGSPVHAADAAARLTALEELAPGHRVSIRAAHARAEAAADPAALRAVGEQWEQKGALLHAAECFASASRAARIAGSAREAAADAQRVATLVAACEGANTPLLRFTGAVDPLTPREREIASLAAQGLSSNEIAQRLFLSPRTVNNHLQSTYTKLGIRGRRELQV